MVGRIIILHGSYNDNYDRVVDFIVYASHCHMPSHMPSMQISQRVNNIGCMTSHPKISQCMTQTNHDIKVKG